MTPAALLRWIVSEWRLARVTASEAGARCITNSAKEIDMDNWLGIDLRCAEPGCGAPISGVEYHLCDERCSRCYERATGRRLRRTKKRTSVPPKQVPGQQDLF